MGGPCNPKVPIPHWKSYKIDGIRELEMVQRMLAARGLRDPWARNEVWRYQQSNYGGEWRNAAKSVGRGLRWAVLGMALTITWEKLRQRSITHHNCPEGPPPGKKYDYGCDQRSDE